jgi:hypothetical protein
MSAYLQPSSQKRVAHPDTSCKVQINQYEELPSNCSRRVSCPDAIVASCPYAVASPVLPALQANLSLLLQISSASERSKSRSPSCNCRCRGRSGREKHVRPLAMGSKGRNVISTSDYNRRATNTPASAGSTITSHRTSRTSKTPSSSPSRRLPALPPPRRYYPAWRRPHGSSGSARPNRWPSSSPR